MFQILDNLTGSGLAGVTTLTQGTTGTVIFTILGVSLFVLVLSLLAMVYKGAKKLMSVGAGKHGR